MTQLIDQIVQVIDEHDCNEWSTLTIIRLDLLLVQTETVFSIFTVVFAAGYATWAKFDLHLSIRKRAENGEMRTIRQINSSCTRSAIVMRPRQSHYRSLAIRLLYAVLLLGLLTAEKSHVQAIAKQSQFATSMRQQYELIRRQVEQERQRILQEAANKRTALRHRWETESSVRRNQ